MLCKLPHHTVPRETSHRVGKCQHCCFCFPLTNPLVFSLNMVLTEVAFFVSCFLQELRWEFQSCLPTVCPFWHLTASLLVSLVSGMWDQVLKKKKKKKTFECCWMSIEVHPQRYSQQSLENLCCNEEKEEFHLGLQVTYRTIKLVYLRTVEGWKNISPSPKFWNMNYEKLGATLSMQATP